ncbi:hypothetical protein HG263_01270 [Pseudoalteromonas sp. JBTF-M23]|uniref:Uncharacterized protein n=1 Tax=Pseudoalteromonas caenipelagi TaxID=2726988 RepID=A0A849V969_9GAMM|nr:hypothetical protein [Pseudoalteromonas caenipelagi]NOU49183.1 hypothetical protein [Pseudoalteromonas caenipelagi]
MKKFLLLLLIMSPPVLSGTIKCTGTVEKLGLHSSNKIMLKLSSMNQAVFICQPNQEWSVPGTNYKTSPEMCNSLLSMLMHAKSTNAQMGSVWFDGDDVPTSCNGWESWKTANIRYFLY